MRTRSKIALVGLKLAGVTAAVVVAVFAAGCGGGSGTDGEGSGAAVPNVLLITVDTLRADHVGAYGADIATPNMDALAAAGVRFENARSHIPITGPSHSSLFTSRLPMEHGVHNNVQELTPRFPTLAEAMRASGRRTGAVISLGVMQAKFGYDRGFDHYSGRFERDWMKNGAEVTDEVLSLAGGSLGKPYFVWAHYSDPHEPYAPPDLDYPKIEIRLNGRALGRIDAGGRGNRFDIMLQPGASELEFIPLDPEHERVYRLNGMRVSEPSIETEFTTGWKDSGKRVGLSKNQTKLPASLRFTNPSVEPVRARFGVAFKQLLKGPEIRARYAAEVEYADREIGRLLDGLDARGLLENTLVILTADHGEGLGDHDLVGHISQLYDSLLRVPLVFAWPGELPQGAVVDYPAGLVDVFPTISELLEIEAPSGASGISLVSVLRGGDLQERSVVAATYRPQSVHDKRGLIIGGFKYIHSWTDERDWEELYDLGKDPGELEDLAEADPETLARIRVELERRLAAASESSPVQADLSDEEKAQLRALGYVN